MASMVISTDRFGDVTIDEDDIISLPDGLVGFVGLERVVVLPVDEDGMFSWLQSVDDGRLAFLVLTPWLLFPDYAPEVSDADQALLELDDASDASVLCVVTSHQEPRRFTANLLGPIIINWRLRRGRQVVLDGDHPTQAALPDPSG